MPEATAPEADIRQLLLAGRADVEKLVELRRAQARSPDHRRQLERLVVELMENPTVDGEELGAEDAALIVGVGLWALGRLEEAIANLTNTSSAEADYFTGRCYLEAGFYERAVEALERAQRGKAATKHLAAVAHAEATARAGRPEAALTALRALARAKPKDAEVHYALGLCHDEAGRHADAEAAYEKALSLDPDAQAATFRLAYNCARRGEEDRALARYEAIATASVTYTNALINLGVLYENRRDFEKAIGCYRRVLRVAPNHARARMYLKDAHASLDMVYDEDRQRELDRRSKLLQIPVSDFELSVRVRNCLQRMNIYNLGDLVSHTEEELLASKNFGETSLQEIKEMLTARGLRLGQGREAIEEEALVEARAAPEAAAAAPVDEAVLHTAIGELDLSIRSRKCMERLGIATIGQLIEHTPDELLASRNFGRTSLIEVNEKLTRYGLTLKEPSPPPPADEEPEEEGGEDQDAQ